MTVRLSVINNNRDCLGVGSVEAVAGMKTTLGVITRLSPSGKSIYVQTKSGELLFRGIDHCPSVVEKEAKKYGDKFRTYSK